MKEIVLQGPNPQQFQAICDELGENSDRFKCNLKLLAEWMRYQPHLPKSYDPEILPVFLRGCKHDLERAKRKLDTYFTARSSVTEFFANRDPLSEESLVSAKVLQIATLPKLTPAGYRVTFYKFSNADLSLFTPKSVFRLILMLGDLRMLEETPIAGDVFVFDLKNLTTGHYTRLAQPALLSRLLTVIQQAYPQRLAQIHIVGASSHIHCLLSLFKQFMKEKMRNRFHLHSDATSLCQQLTSDCLPREYGGNLASMEELHDLWQKKLAAHQSWFLQHEFLQVDNSKRPEKVGVPTFCGQDSIFGNEGAFRKLNID